MGCSGSKKQAKDPVTKGDDAKTSTKPGPQESTNSNSSVMHREANLAKDLLNAIVQTTTPTIKRGIELLLIKHNETGGLPLFVTAPHEEPNYKLRVIKQGGGKLMPGDILKKVKIKVQDVHSFRTSAQTEEDVAKMPAKVQPIASEVLMLDLKFDVQVDFREEGGKDSNIDFQVHGEKWWSPTLGSVSIDTCHVDAHCRVWWSLVMRSVFVGFHEEPQIQWDVEAHLGQLGIPLPDFVEDSFVAWSVRKVLSWFTVDRPLECPMPDPTDIPKEALEALKLGIDAESEVAREYRL